MNSETLFQQNNLKNYLTLLTAMLMVPFFIDAAPLVTCGTGTTMCTLSDLITLADTVINFALLSLAAPLAVLSIAIGGVLMITARGDTGQLQRGKDIFYNTVIGFVIAFGAWLIVEAVLTALVSDSTTLGKLGAYIELK